MIFKRIIKKILKKIIPVQKLLEKEDFVWIQKEQDLLKIQQAKSQVQIDDHSDFYPEAKVFNFQNNVSSIRVLSGTHIRGELLVFPYGGRIQIGQDCYIGEHSRIWSASDIKIGNGVLISHNVNIMDTNSHEMNHFERVEGYKKMLKEGHPKETPNVKSAPITIEDFVWINFNAVVLKGVTIGEGVIVAPNTVVDQDIPPYSLVTGNPCQVKKR